jgi:hypothetical protein
MTFTIKKGCPKNLGYFCNFQKTAQSKHSPNKQYIVHPIWSQKGQYCCATLSRNKFDVDGTITIENLGCQIFLGT